MHPACTMRVSSGLPGSIAAPAVSSASTVRCRGCPGSLWSTSPGPRCISGVWWLLEGPGDSSCRKATGSCWLGFQNDWLPGPPASFCRASSLPRFLHSSESQQPAASHRAAPLGPGTRTWAVCVSPTWPVPFRVCPCSAPGAFVCLKACFGYHVWGAWSSVVTEFRDPWLTVGVMHCFRPGLGVL